MKLVAIEEVVAEAISVLGSAGDEEVAKNFARQWIWSALKKLGTSDQTIEVSEIAAKNLLLKKPNNLKLMLDIALFDVNGNYIPHIFHSGNKRIYPNTEAYGYKVVSNEGTALEETTTHYLPVDLSESPTSYVLGTNGAIISTALVRYYPYPLDENNLPEVREHEVDACIAFVRYRWSQRLNLNQSEIRENKITWKEEADWCVAKKKSMDFNGEVRKRIAAQFNRQLPNFNRSQS